MINKYYKMISGHEIIDIKKWLLNINVSLSM